MGSRREVAGRLVRMRVLGALAALCALALLAGGCGSSGGGGSSSGGGGSAGGTLTIGRASEVISLDPQQITIGQDIITQQALYDALVQPTVDFKGTEKRLATSMEYDKAAREYTFAIPAGLKFSDGTPLTSKDVAFSIEWAKGAAIFGAMLESIARIETPDPETVKLKLSRFDSMVLPGLSYAFIVPEDFGGAAPRQFFAKPVSSGPFVLDSWSQGQEMQLSRNPRYRQPAALDSVVFKVMSDQNARANALQAGEIQLNEYVPEEQIDQVAPEQLIEVNPSARLVLTVTNNKAEPFDDPDVRRAMALAVNRAELLEAVWRGHGQPVEGLLPPGVANAVGTKQGPELWGYDPGEASRLLSSSSHPGASLTLLTSYDRGVDSTLANAVQNQLSQAGFKVKLEVTDFATLVDRLLAGEFESVMMTNGGYLPTAGEGIVTYATLFAPTAGWDQKRVDGFVEQFRRGEDDAARDAVTEGFEEWINGDAVAAPVGTPFVYLARAPEVEGLEVSPPATFRLDEVTVG